MSISLVSDTKTLRKEITFTLMHALVDLVNKICENM